MASSTSSLTLPSATLVHLAILRALAVAAMVSQCSTYHPMITACRVTSPFGAKLSVTTSHATASRAVDPSGSANSVTRVSHPSGRKRLAYLSGHKRVAFALYGNAGLFKHEPFEFNEERATGSLHALLFFWRVHLLLSLRVSRDAQAPWTHH